MKQTHKLFDPFQIIGFTVSTAISVLLIVSGQDQISSITLGLVLSIITQLFDLQMRLSTSESKLLAANALSKKLYKDEWLLERMNEIVNNYQKINETLFDPLNFRKNTRSAIINCCEILSDMVNGTFTPYRFPLQESTSAIKEARKEVKAVDCGDIDFWQNAYANDYINSNLEAIQKGINIKRIFIHSISNLRNNLNLLKKQQDIGVDIYIVYPEQLPTELKDDYLIVDDSFVILSEFGSDGKVRGNKVCIAKLEVEKVIRNFNQILRYARKLDDVVNELK